MKKLLLLAGFGIAAHANTVSACSCFGNSSYCQTLAPGWFNPVATAMVVKLSTYYYGITVKVVQTFGGTSLPDDTLTVWGDNGALCRIYLDGIPDGDTLVFGLNETDFMGNYIPAGFPPGLEQPGDYIVSVCGIYALNFDNGLVTGYITGPNEESMTVEDFEAMVTACTLGVGVQETGEGDPLAVRYVAGEPEIEMSGVTSLAQLEVIDARGCTVLSRRWNGAPFRFSGWTSGAYVAVMRTGGKVRTVKLTVQ